MLRRIFNVVTNLSGTRDLGYFKRLKHAKSGNWCKCNKFCLDYLCIFLTQVFGVVFSNRLDIVKFILIKIISLMVVKKVKVQQEANCNIVAFNLRV